MKEKKFSFAAFCQKNTTIVVEIGIIIFFSIILVIFQLLKLNSDICEWYSRTIGRFFQTVNGALTKYLPFSLTELFVILLVIFCITILILGLISFSKKKISEGLSRLLLVIVSLLGVVTWYNASATLQYNRLAVPLPLYNESVSVTQVDEVIQYFLDDYNQCASLLEYEEDGEVISPYSIGELNRLIEKEMKKLDDDYFNSFTTYAKPLLSSYLYREFGITGLYFSPFGESNINILSTNSEIPFTMAHEIAHSKGVMREDDANMVAAYITLTSEDYYLRYSGYIYTFTRLLSLANYSPTENAYSFFRQQMDQNIINNYSYINSYWNSHNAYQKFIDWLNSLYLKSQGESQGTDSYNDTNPDYNETTQTIVSLSNYQKIYYQIYVDAKGSL